MSSCVPVRSGNLIESLKLLWLNIMAMPRSFSFTVI